MSSNRTVIFNCGASHVSASVFSSNNGALVLEEYGSQQLEYDYSVDGDWLNALTFAVRDLLNQYKLKGAATMIMPGYQLLTKSIKVPYVDQSKQAQIIAFEAQQNIPYPLHEVVWDSQVIADDGVETEVILLAVKGEVVNNFCGQMGAQGLVPRGVQAASMLDYNAFKLAYPNESEGVLLINMGARSSNLLFINESGFFVRNIALGGNSLTQSLADNLGKPFQQAEGIKVAYFSGQTSYEADHPSVQILETNAQAFQKRMGQEITRSIVNFRRQRSAKAPSRILLTGKCSQLPGLVDYLSKAQKVPVEYFNPLSAVSLGSKVDEGYLNEHLHNLSEVIGEAARMVSTDAVSINLLPAALSNRMAFEKKKPFIVAAAALLALSTVAPFIHFQSNANAVEEANKELSRRISPLQNFQTQIEAQKAEATKLASNVGHMDKLVDTKSNWVIFLSDLQDRLQKIQDVWLNDLSVDRKKNNNLKLSGRMLIKDYDPDSPTESGRAAAKRVNLLLTSFTESEFVQEVNSIKFNNDNPRILEFNFTLVPNSEKPL